MLIPEPNCLVDIPQPKTVKTNGASAPLSLFLIFLDPVLSSILIIADSVIASWEEPLLFAIEAVEAKSFAGGTSTFGVYGVKVKLNLLSETSKFTLLIYPKANTYI